MNQFSLLVFICGTLMSCNAEPSQQTTTPPAKQTTVKTTSASGKVVAKPATASTGSAKTATKTSTSITKASGTKSNSSTKAPSTSGSSKSLTTTKPAQSSGNSSGIKTGASSQSIQSGGSKPINTSGTGPQKPNLPQPTTPTTTTTNTGGSSTGSSTTTSSDGKGRGGSTNSGGTTNTTPTPSPTTNNDGKGRGGSNTSGNTGSTNKGGSTSSGGGVGDILGDILGGGGPFTEADAAKAIKEALMKGISTGVDKVSITDGYFGNSLIKIPFPKDAQIVESTLRQVGMGSMIDNVVLASNRAAESAAKQALPIFVNSITQMTITDAVNIVSNKQSDAATQFLQRTTTEPLVSAFKPSIKSALDKTLATKYWADMMGYYNKIPFVQKINPDLTDFVTRKAVSGLFYMIAQEEARIRKDPGARTSDILKKVFGNVKF